MAEKKIRTPAPAWPKEIRDELTALALALTRMSIKVRKTSARALPIEGEAPAAASANIQPRYFPAMHLLRRLRPIVDGVDQKLDELDNML